MAASRIELIFALLTHATLCFREIRVYPKIRELSSETLFQTPRTSKIWPRHADSGRVRYKQRQRAVCCLQHLAATASESTVYDNRRMLLNALSVQLRKA